MPKVHKARARQMNPKLKDSAETECQRLKKYLWVESDSTIASPLVVAPKARFPYICICGDYVWINKWIRMGQHYIPVAMKELEKAAGFKYYLDIDLTNAFHQLRLSERTATIH